MASASYPEEFNNEKNLKRLGTYLRSPEGVKVRSAVEHGKRVEYFKGKRLIESLLSPGKAWPKELPKIEEKAVAVQVAALLLRKAFFHRSEKDEEHKGVLVISQKKVFEDTGYYTWIFSGNMMWSHFFTTAIIVVVIICTLLPVWPLVMKKILWYFAVTFLLATFIFCSVRILLFLLCWICGYEFWILPRLFDESLGVMESFTPLYSFENSAEGQGYYRIGLLLMFAAFIGWCMTQPTDFDTFMEGQKTFIDDIYSGNLLTDFSQASKDRMNGLMKDRVPDLDDLLRQVEMDELDNKAHQHEGEQRTDFSVGDDEVFSQETGVDGDKTEELEESVLDELLNEADENE